LLEKERRWEWQQESRTVSRAVVGGNSAAMANAIECGQGCVDDVPASSPSGVGDEADSARVVLESGVVKARTSQSLRYRIGYGVREPQSIGDKSRDRTWMLDTTGCGDDLDPSRVERRCHAPSAPAPNKTAPLPTVARARSLR